MSKFTKFEDFHLLEGSKYIAKSDTVWYVGKKDSNWPLELKAGETFDISVPKGLGVFQNRHDKDVLMGAWVHDRLLERGYDEAFASSEFRRACIARGVSKTRSWILFYSTFYYTLLRSCKDKLFNR